MDSKQLNHVNSIDALRGIAALAVLIFHAREVMWIGTRNAWAEYGTSPDFNALLGYLSTPFFFGSAGVPLFFVISGYCIHRPLALRPDRDPRWGLYTKRRFLRIYPTMAGALLLTAAADAYVRSVHPLDGKLGDNSFFCFLSNLLSMQNILSPIYGSNGPLWTLSIEIHLYAFYPLLLFLARRTNATRTLLLTLLLATISIGGLRFTGLWFENVFAYLFLWWTGAVIAEVEAGRVGLPCKHLLPWAGLFGALAFACHTYDFVLAQFPYALSFGLLVAWSITPRGRSLFDGRVGKWCAWVGVFSYSLYATHVPLLVLFRSLMLDGRDSHRFIFVGIGAVLCIAAAWLFFLLIERWSIKKIQALKRPGKG